MFERIFWYEKRKKNQDLCNLYFLMKPILFRDRSFFSFRHNAIMNYIFHFQTYLFEEKSSIPNHFDHKWIHLNVLSDINFVTRFFFIVTKKKQKRLKRKVNSILHFSQRNKNRNYFFSNGTKMIPFNFEFFWDEFWFFASNRLEKKFVFLFQI